MMDSEILFPVKCPVCSQQVLTAFRMGVVAHALDTGDIRLYANCHLTGWDASAAELKTIREFLDATFSEDLGDAFQELTLDDLSYGDELAVMNTDGFDVLGPDDARDADLR